tara:strand:+ start:136 stop:351 length:216 start_codon:yes stop_codon:yes gene_type:complete
MKVIELELVAEKEKLEYELENALNDKSISTEEQVKKIKDLLILQTQNINSLQMWSSYMVNVNKAEQNNNKE